MNLDSIDSIAIVRHRAADYVERGWCQHYSAVNAEGLSVAVESPRAVAWCARGAIARACFDLIENRIDAHKAAMVVVSALRRESGHSVSSWNDDLRRTQADVVALLRGEAP